MKIQTLLTCGAVTLLSLSPAFAQSSSWEAPFAGADATGANVVALWHFDADAPGKDASGHGHDLRLRGKDTHYVPDGKFGGGLMVEEKTEPGDKAEGADTKNTADLNPKGAFTVELWISPGEDSTKAPTQFLVDKKYYNYSKDIPQANTGYMLALRKAAGDKFTLHAQLGFGTDSAIVESTPQTFEIGQWYHVAFTYDGKGGVSFFLGNTRIGQSQLKNRGAITAGTYPVVIGDRVGSSHQRFHGHIDEVRILNTAVQYVSGKVLLDTSGGRTAFYRMEKDAKVQVRVFNDTLQPLKNASVQIKAAGVFNKTISVPELDAGKSTFVTVPLDTTLRPDSYQVSAVVQNAQNKDIGDAMNFPLTIVPRELPNKTPIVMWAGATSDYKQLTDIGYTGELVSMANYGQIWKDGSGPAMTEDQTTAMRKKLDEMMAAGVGGLATLSPSRVVPDLHPEFDRTDRAGKKVENADGLYPEVQKFNYDTGAAVARTFGDMPGWKGALIHSEIRDHTAPSFNDIDKKAYHDFSGQDIPSIITSSRGVTYQGLPNFPANHIVADDDPILKYYKWFWKEGDAWPKLNSQVNDGLKSTGRNDIFTWHDPAVRVPSIYGSGGNVDFLNQWTYTYPDPLKVGLATDELFAMAEGHPGQKVMNMIQIIWYRAQTTGTPVKGQETEWEKVSPDAKFISIAPDHLSEGTWLELARPVQSIANHGWGSLGDKLGFSQGSYITTNLDSRKRMTYLFQNVVKPLQPALRQVPDHPADVAFLESFASQMFAGTGTYGWGGGWGADSYMIARYAGLQPQIIYDETIQEKGLSQYKVLFLTDCPVLTQSVADAIKKFQQNGGIVIGDDNLAPGISPDILMSKINRTTPDATKALLIKNAAQLRGELDTFYQHPLESSNPEVITRLRQSGDGQYVFTVNDHRTYGDYVGQYKKVMEKGLPSQTQITLNTMPQGSVYDLMNHKQVPTTRILGKVQFPVSLNGGEGNVFLVTPKPIGKLVVTSPSSVNLGKSIPVKVLLSDNSDKTLDAIVPLKVTIRDSKGRVAEKSGYYGAAKGLLNLNLDIATNDVKGKWQIEVTEALTGQTVTRNFDVK